MTVKSLAGASGLALALACATPPTAQVVTYRPLFISSLVEQQAAEP